MMNAMMDPAVAALGGAVIGAVIGGAIGLIVAARSVHRRCERSTTLLGAVVDLIVKEAAGR